MSWKRLKDKKLQERLKTRARIIQLIREFFIKEGFLEVETPILVPAAGQEPYLNPMKVEFLGCHSEGAARRLKNPVLKSTGFLRQAQDRLFANAQDDGYLKGYLITSPEYAHKKLLAAGFEKTFEITRAFRSGEPWGGLHNPEFTMLEWYRAHADYTKIMEDVEKMVQYVAQAIFDIRYSKLEDQYLISNFKYQDKSIDLSSPWQRITMAEAWRKYTGIMIRQKTHDREFFADQCRARGYTVKRTDNYDDLFFKIFLTHIEPKLGFPKPTILYEYPASMASLARLKNIKTQEHKNTRTSSLVHKSSSSSVSRWAERFEVYIAGMELANAFSELTDAAEQRRRFIEEQKLRKKLGKELIPLDEDFLDALGHMPPSAGIAFGIDRLVILLTNASRIEDVLAFPAGELWS